MFVLCPHCQFLVAVDPASGRPPASCPRCDGALATAADAAAPAASAADAVETPPAAAQAEPDETLPAPPAEASESTPPPESPAAPPEPDVAEMAPAIAPPMPESSEEPSEEDSTAPVTAQTSAPAPAATAPRRRSALLPILALSILLALQLTLADRAQLAADAQWRPALAVLCGALRCALPPWHEPAALTFIERDVTPDPRRPGVLHVRARFRNDARWSQAWPQLSLTLSDADGRVAGERLFAPVEYLGRRPTENGLASGQIVAIAIDVIEPAPHIVAFTFDLR